MSPPKIASLEYSVVKQILKYTYKCRILLKKCRYMWYLSGLGGGTIWKDYIPYNKYHLHNIPEWQDYRAEDQISGFQCCEFSYKRQHKRVPWSDETVLYFACDYRNLYMESNCIELHTHTHEYIWKLNKICNLASSIVPTSASWFCSCTYKMSSLEKAGEEFTRPQVLYFAISYESVISE